QLGEVVQQLHHPAVVGLEEGLERQDGEQLVLGVVLARELRRVGRQCLLGQAQGLAGHGARRLGHRSGGLHTWLDAAPRPRVSTEHGVIFAASALAGFAVAWTWWKSELALVGGVIWSVVFLGVSHWIFSDVAPRLWRGRLRPLPPDVETAARAKFV